MRRDISSAAELEALVASLGDGGSSSIYTFLIVFSSDTFSLDFDIDFDSGALPTTYISISNLLHRKEHKNEVQKRLYEAQESLREMKTVLTMYNYIENIFSMCEQNTNKIISDNKIIYDFKNYIVVTNKKMNQLKIVKKDESYTADVNNIKKIKGDTLFILNTKHLQWGTSVDTSILLNTKYKWNHVATKVKNVNKILSTLKNDLTGK